MLNVPVVKVDYLNVPCTDQRVFQALYRPESEYCEYTDQRVYTTQNKMKFI